MGWGAAEVLAGATALADVAAGVVGGGVVGTDAVAVALACALDAAVEDELLWQAVMAMVAMASPATPGKSLRLRVMFMLCPILCPFLVARSRRRDQLLGREFLT